MEHKKSPLRAAAPKWVQGYTENKLPAYCYRILCLLLYEQTRYRKDIHKDIKEATHSLWLQSRLSLLRILKNRPCLAYGLKEKVCESALRCVYGNSKRDLRGVYTPQEIARLARFLSRKHAAHETSLIETLQEVV